MNLNALIAAIGTHNWLVLVMLGALYARTLFSNKSRFPWSWAPNWLPLFSGLAGAVITVDAAMQGGSTLGAALPVGFLGLVAGGFFDGLLAAIFGSPANAPTWAKFLVGIIDDIEGGSPGGGAAKPKTDAVTAAASALPKPPASARLASAFACMLLLTGCAALFGATSAALDCGSKVLDDAAQGMTVTQILADVPSQCGYDLEKIIGIIAASKDPKVTKSKAYGEVLRMKATLDAAPAGN